MLPSYKTVPTDWRFRAVVKWLSFVYDCCYLVVNVRMMFLLLTVSLTFVKGFSDS
jgi:hypothetical protein